MYMYWFYSILLYIWLHNYIYIWLYIYMIIYIYISIYDYIYIWLYLYIYDYIWIYIYVIIYEYIYIWFMNYNNGLSNDPNGTSRKMEGFCKATTPSHQIQGTHHPQPLRFMQRFFHGFGKARLLKPQRGFGKLWKAGDFGGWNTRFVLGDHYPLLI